MIPNSQNSSVLNFIILKWISLEDIKGHYIIFNFLWAINKKDGYIFIFCFLFSIVTIVALLLSFV